MSRILYTIPVHMCPECVKQMCDGIFFFDENAIIVLHVSRSQNIEDYNYNYDNVIINPMQFDTCWGWDLSRIHVSNYLYVMRNYNFDISYIIFLTSNCLMLKNPFNYIKNYDVGFSEINYPYKLTPPLITERNKGWFGDFGDNVHFRGILEELNICDFYGCILDGCFVNNVIMDKISYLYEKYFNYEFYPHSFEEKIFPTIGCNLTNKIGDSLIDLNTVDLDSFKQKVKDDNLFFNKRVDRIINNPVRLYYDTIIHKKS